jgi:hypothetical protein
MYLLVLLRETLASARMVILRRTYREAVLLSQRTEKCDYFELGQRIKRGRRFIGTDQRRSADDRRSLSSAQSMRLGARNPFRILREDRS